MIQNLITKENRLQLKQGYNRRRVIVLAWAIFLSSIVSSVLLIPPYLSAYYRLVSITEKNNAVLSPVDKQVDVLEQLNIINSKSATVLSFSNNLDITDRVAQVYKVKGSAISINSFSYGGTELPIMKLAGIADSREALLSFQKAVQEIGFVKNVQVPVGDFVKDTDLPFSMDVTTIK